MKIKTPRLKVSPTPNKKSWRPARALTPPARPQYQHRRQQKLHQQQAKISQAWRLRTKNKIIFLLLHLLTYLAVATVILGGLYLALTRYLLVADVSCHLNQDLPCPPQLLEQTQTLLGRPLLFYNFEHDLNSWRTSEFNFTASDYYKIFPNQLVLDFKFDSPYYQITSDGQTWFNFDQYGNYTILPAPESSLQIWLSPPSLQENLNAFTLNPVLGQKFFDLAYLSAGARANWRRVLVHDQRTLQIETNLATYYLDFFALDENLQKLDFIENSDWQVETNNPVVDLRLNLPVIKTASTSTDSAKQ